MMDSENLLMKGRAEMADIIKKAADGQQKSMKLLYDSNKQKVYYVSLCLLGNAYQAAEAAYHTFKSVWGGIKSNGIRTESDFSHFALRTAVEYCKGRLTKQSPKAFRLPYNRSFLVTVDKKGKGRDDEPAMAMLSTLPALQRFIFVMHTVGGYMPEQIANSFRFDLRSVDAALEAEKANIEQAAHSIGTAMSYETVVSALAEGEQKAAYPATMDEKVYAAIAEISAPLEKKMRKKWNLIGLSILALIAIVFAVVFAKGLPGDDTDSLQNSGEETDSTLISSPVIELDENATYYADIEIADYGTITVELDQHTAPVTVSNFVNLAQNGFYDGLSFHRIMEGFMMQGGDPEGNGTGGNTDENGEEINIVGEFSNNGYENTISHTRGTISMARSSSGYDTASSQFFIMQEDTTSLDGNYAAFGHVVEGIEIVDAVCEDAEPTDDNGTIPADEQPVITSITIRTE